MKVGDKVRVLKIPQNLPEGELKTQSLFKLCLGHVLPVAGLYGELLELEVGEVLGEPSYMHSIWIELEFVELV